MKPRFYHIIFAIGFSGWMVSCGNSVSINQPSEKKENNNQEKNIVEKKDTFTDENNPAKNKSEEEELIQFDANAFLTDTTLYLDNYHIIIGKEKFDATHKAYKPDDIEFNQLIIYFTQKDNDSVILKKTFEENQFVKMFSFKEKNTTYISLSSYSGGSGFTSTIYQIKLDEKPTFIEIFNYNELTFYTFNKDGSELLYLQGIWDMTEAAEEAHFSDHCYSIGTISLTPNGATHEVIHGKTKQKYPCYDYETTTEMLVQVIHKNEPTVFKTIDLNKYAVQ
jgi:hypothetical protein